ncbi:MAG: hypothetical protein AMXMBFR33_61320 [Candidatus Xenobia bacterium]
MASQAETLMKSGREAYAADQHDRALELFEQALKADPGYCDAYIGLASVFQVRGEADKMIAECERGIAVQPDYAPFYSTRAIGYGLLGQHARSLQDFTRAIELDPLNAFFFVNRAKTYIRMELFDQAANDFGQAARAELEFCKKVGQIPRESANYMRARAEMLRKAGKEEEARQADLEAQEVEKTLAAAGKSGCGKAASVILLLLWWAL